jgi:4-amino-4-deoxy-L-arabinose transferase-like glycosyltransferase
MTRDHDSPLYSRQRRRAAGIVGLVLLLGFGFQGTRGIWSPDEGRHAVIARTMLESGNWLIPHVGLQVLLDKPPLSHWAMAAGMWLVGLNEWGARLSHALWYALTALLVFVLGRELWGARTGRLAAVLYATMLLPFVAANVLTPDTPLTFWTTASMAAFWFARPGAERHTRSWKVVLGCTLALGVLTKGPAALIPTSAMLVFLALSGGLGTFFLSWGLALGAVAFLAIGLAWYVHVGVTLPGALEYLWDNHVVGRLLTDSYRRSPGLAGAVKIYLPVLVEGTLPAALVLWLQLGRGWRRLLHAQFWQRLRRSPAELLVVAWIVVPCAILALASSKLPLYFLPITPAFALLCARLGLLEIETRRAPVTWIGLPVRSSWLLGAWIAVLLGLKLAGGMVDIDRDMRQLADHLREALPPTPFEIVCVDFRCEGLVFYLGGAVERVTSSSQPYPVFGGTEPIAEEFGELPETTYHHVVVYEADDERRVRRELAPYAALCSSAPIVLPHNRLAMVCRAAKPTKPIIEPEPHHSGRSTGDIDREIGAAR